MAGRKIAHKPDALKLAALFADILRPIQTEAENERALKIVEALCDKHNPTPEEDIVLDVLSRLIEKFEDEHYAIPAAPPHRVLRMLIDNRSLPADVLAPVVGSQTALDDILSGQRLPAPDEACRLGDYFNLAPTAFLAA